MGKKSEKQQQIQIEKLDELLALTREASRKIDNLAGRVGHLELHILELEQRMGKLGIKAAVAGALSGAITTVGIQIIKAQLGG